MPAPRTRRRLHGFTLVELLVSLFALSLLAVLGWRGLDGMARAQQQTQARSDRVLALQVGLAQWSADLDAVIQLPRMSAIEWNGRVMRLVRRSPGGDGEGVVVAAWSRRSVGGQDTWLRWQSAPLTRRDQVDQAWQQADLWAQNAGAAERAREAAVVPLAGWQVFFYRGNAWTNPLSSDATTVRTPPATPGEQADTVLPDGVRLVLTLPPDHPVPGTLITDWVSPRVGGNKS
jgi:general secretion pathway protein J